MDEYRGQKILIAGGLGFTGSNLAIRLVKSGASVTLLDSMHPTCGGKYFNIAPIKNDVEVVEGDSCDLGLVRKLVQGKILLKAAGGGSYRIVPFPSDKKTIGSVYSSSAKFSGATGWKALTSIEESLTPTLEYYRRHREHYW